MPALRLFLLRHGEVEDRYHKVFGGGQIDMELSPRGHAQAEALAGYLSNVRFDAIYASPMKRAQQTLAPLATQYEFAPCLIPDLREVDFGTWTGLSWQELHDRHQVSAFQWLEMMEKAAIPEGECSKTFRGRVEPCVRKIVESHADQTVAIVCHGGVVRMILAVLLNVPLASMTHIEISYASVSEVHCSADRTEVQLLNFTPWRDLQKS